MKLALKSWRYVVNVFISLDQFLNVLLGGDPDETISSRIGKLKRDNGGRLPRWRILTRTTDRCLEFFDKDHTIEAIEEDEGNDAVYNLPD